MEGFIPQDFQTAIGALPQKGLQESAQALAQALESSGEQCEEYWRNRIWPFWQNIWPKSQSRASNSIAQSLARMSIAARGEFPSALSAVIDWLQPIEYSESLVNQLYDSGLAVRYPEEALRLLNAVLDNQPRAPRQLGNCLDEISLAKPALLQDHRYRRLDEYRHQHRI